MLQYARLMTDLGGQVGKIGRIWRSRSGTQRRRGWSIVEEARFLPRRPGEGALSFIGKCNLNGTGI